VLVQPRKQRQNIPGSCSRHHQSEQVVHRHPVAFTELGEFVLVETFSPEPMMLLFWCSLFKGRTDRFNPAKHDAIIDNYHVPTGQPSTNIGCLMFATSICLKMGHARYAMVFPQNPIVLTSSKWKRIMIPGHATAGTTALIIDDSGRIRITSKHSTDGSNLYLNGLWNSQWTNFSIIVNVIQME